MMREKIGKIMKVSGVCMALVCGCTAAVYGEEVHTEYSECVPVMEIAEEVVIEPEMSLEEAVCSADVALLCEKTEEMDIILENEWSMETAEILPVDTKTIKDTEIIQAAIDSGTEVTITINEDLVVDTTIFIPEGKTVAFVPADGVNVTMFRGENLCGTFFFVEKGGTLILNCDGLENAGLTIEGMNLTSAVADDSCDPLSDIISGEGDVIIDDGGFMWETKDLSEAYIEILGGDDLTYNGNPHVPEVLVWMGTQMLMKGFDYDVAYYHNVNAGKAEIVVTATGMGTCTGTGSAAFWIQPVEPQYKISDQIVECGVELSQIPTSEYAVGVQGERIDGELLWAASEGGNALPADMMLSGAEGDTMELFWTFYPEENYTNYVPVSGSVILSFVMPEGGGLWDEDLWGNPGDDVGNLSGGSSSSGVTGDDEISVDLSTELTTELPETETPETETPVTEEPTAEEPMTEEPTTEEPQSDTADKETTGTEKKSSNGKTVVKNPVSGTISNTGVQTGTSVIRTGSGSFGSAVSVGNGVSVSKTNPRTGDDTTAGFWCLLALLAVGIFLLDTKGRILYNGKR